MTKLGGHAGYGGDLSNELAEEFEQKLYDLMKEYQVYKVDVSINPYEE